MPADFAMPIQAEKVAVDSGMRVLITEPRTRTVHILDFANRKYSRIDVAKGDRMTSPYAIAVDANTIFMLPTLLAAGLPFTAWMAGLRNS